VWSVTRNIGIWAASRPPGEFMKARNAEQPVSDVIDRVANGALLGRAHHSSDDTNMLGQKRG
jgi:hypothetical protein